MRTLKTLGLALLAAAPLAAQEPSHQMGPGMMEHRMPMMDEMMAPMMRGMAFAPAHLLERKAALDLTAQQVTRLTAIGDAAKTAHDAAMNEAKTHMQELAQAMKAAAPDSNALKTHFQAAHAAMGRAHWTMLAAAAQARAVLTEGQRGRVDGWVDVMQMHRADEQEHHPEHPAEHP